MSYFNLLQWIYLSCTSDSHIINNLQIKFESDRAKTVAYITPTGFYRKSPEVNLF